MKSGQRLQTRDELTLVVNLYSKLEFGQIQGRNPQTIELARLIKQNPGSVAFTLVNFAGLNRVLKKGRTKRSGVIFCNMKEKK